MKLICPICKTELKKDTSFECYFSCENYIGKAAWHSYCIDITENCSFETYYDIFDQFKIEHRIDDKFTTILHFTGEKRLFDKLLINFWSDSLNEDIKKLMMLL